MRDHRDGSAVAIEKKLHLLEDSGLERLEALPRRRGEVGITSHPLPRVFRIHLFNLLPAHTFPLSEINLPQCGPYHLRDLSNSSDRLRSSAGATQITAIDDIDRLPGEQVGQRCELHAPLGVQLWVGVAAKPSCHLRLRMANK